MKDRFSEQAKAYSNFRPEYPPQLFDFIFSQVAAFDCAWDCGTGNGQVAYPLAERFLKVMATDISTKQLENAKVHPAIQYSIQAAEHSNFENNSFDLITVAQAIHWFNFAQFYEEVKRSLKPNGILAVIGYGLLQTEPKLQTVINYFYYEVVGKYWDAERRYIDENYQSIPFPFNEIVCPPFFSYYEWNAAQLLGYLSTWSACKNYEKAEGKNPLLVIEEKIQEIMGEGSSRVKFPILFRMGKLN